METLLGHERCRRGVGSVERPLNSDPPSFIRPWGPPVTGSSPQCLALYFCDLLHFRLRPRRLVASVLQAAIATPGVGVEGYAKVLEFLGPLQSAPSWAVSLAFVTYLLKRPLIPSRSKCSLGHSGRWILRAAITCPAGSCPAWKESLEGPVCSLCAPAELASRT